MLSTHDIYRRQDQKAQVHVVVLDFRKAFDTVPHDRLLGKLEFDVITGPVHKWIRAFLNPNLMGGWRPPPKRFFGPQKFIFDDIDMPFSPKVDFGSFLGLHEENFSKNLL